MLIKASLIATALLQMGGGVEGDGGSGVPAGTAARSGETGALHYEGTAASLYVPSPFVAEAEVRVDGRLDEPSWSRAAVLTGFSQFEPVEGIPATQATEVRVLVTPDAILFGVHAHDEKDGVRATLARRDRFGRSDDYVRFILDTFDDQRRAYVFQVNPLGVQADGLWVERGGGSPVDWNPDFLWESAGVVHSDGYTAELRIPLNTLRFREAAVQDWGLQVIRRIQRNGFEESWAPISGESANTLAQSGKITGLRNLEPGRFLEFNPVVTGTRQGSWNSESEAFTRSPVSGDFGFNLAYGLTSNLALEGTFNPDFSQVEADAGQITVNERFALFLPEKRSFFLEGTDVFSMPRRLVYTRSIANPVGAVKLAGKAGGFSLGYIGAVDETSGAAGDPLVNLLRIRRDVGASSSVGMVYTDRTAPGSEFNRVLGADLRLVLARRYTLDLMAAGSADGAAGSDTEWGSLFLARFDRSSRSLSLSGSLEDISRDFRARSGFIRRVGTTQAGTRIGYTWRGRAGALVESWGPSLEIEAYWDRDDFWAGGGPQESEVQLNLSMSLRGNVGGFVSFSRDSYSFAVEHYEGLFLREAGADRVVPFLPSSGTFSGLNAFRFRAWLSRWERARLSLGGSWSDTPIFTGGVPADVGERVSGEASLTLYPTGAMNINVGLRHVTITRKRDESVYSSATIPRIQARYQFSRALYLRAIGEYSSQSRGDMLDPLTGAPVLSCSGGECLPRSGSDRYDLRFEGLIGYEPSPGTVVYLGYSQQMTDSAAFSFRDVQTRADGLFVKMSYRFRS